jgi:hypothetical protein
VTANLNSNLSAGMNTDVNAIVGVTVNYLRTLGLFNEHIESL